MTAHLGFPRVVGHGCPSPEIAALTSEPGLPVLLACAPINWSDSGEGTHGIATGNFTWLLKAETRKPEGRLAVIDRQKGG